MNASSNYQYQSDESQDNPLYKQTIFQGKKSFQCSIAGCEKIFRFKSDMERHTVVHSNEKPCVCSYPKCNRKFKRPDALKNHMQAHTEENILMCPMPDCNAQFRKRTILQYHLIKHQILNNMISDPERADQQEIPRPFKQVHRWGEKLALKKLETSAQNNEMEDSDDDESEVSSIYQEDLDQPEAKEGELFSLYPKELSDLSSVKSDEEDDSTSSGTCAQDFLQSICNQLANENKNLRNQLTEKLYLIQEKYKKENEMKPSPIEEFFSFEKFENCESQDFGSN